MRDIALAPGWDECALIDLAHYLNGYAFKPDDWSVDGTPIIRIEQLNNPEGRYDCFRGWFPDANAIDDGDLIFSWSATLKVAIWRRGKGVLNQHLFKVVPKPGFDKHFIFYILDFHMDALGGGSHGSTMKHIKRGELERYTVGVPSLPRQQRIVEILSTIDEAITQTEALIAKTQQIKAGLMHDLFTRGVTADGQLRPPREEAPRFYKESPLGWIPKEWHCSTFEQLLADGILADIQDGNHGELHPKREDFVPEGIPFLMAKDLARGQIDFDGCYRITGAQYRSLRIGFAKEGDVLLSHKGTIGETAIVPTGCLEVMLTPQVTYYRVGSGRLLRSFLLNWMRGAAFQRRMRLVAAQSTRDYVGITAQRKLLFAVLPKEAEQERIASIADRAVSLLRAETIKADKWRLLKNGLMHDLLTGRVRVPVVEIREVAQ